MASSSTTTATTAKLWGYDFNISTKTITYQYHNSDGSGTETGSIVIPKMGGFISQYGREFIRLYGNIYGKEAFEGYMAIILDQQARHMRITPPDEYRPGVIPPDIPADPSPTRTPSSLGGGSSSSGTTTTTTTTTPVGGGAPAPAGAPASPIRAPARPPPPAAPAPAPAPVAGAPPAGIAPLSLRDMNEERKARMEFFKPSPISMFGHYQPFNIDSFSQTGKAPVRAYKNVSHVRPNGSYQVLDTFFLAPHERETFSISPLSARGTLRRF